MRLIYAIIVFILIENENLEKVSGQQSYYVIQGGKLVESAVSPTIEPEAEESIEDTEVEPINLIKTTYGWIQGFCFLDFRSPLLYTENFILEGDGKSQVAATMVIMIGGNTNITCVEVLDKTNGTVPPRILRGGEGYNYVKVSVSPSYGIGFDFSVNIYGVVLA